MIDLMIRDDYELLLNSSRAHYYVGRWKYFNEVIKIIK